MTDREKLLVRELKEALYHAQYPPIFAVNNETLCAAETELQEWLESRGRQPILSAGKNGLFYKGCELVLEVREEGC